LKGQSAPRPYRPLAAWLRTPRIVDGVLAAPVVPRGAADDLDDALCRASRRWRQQPAAARVARAEEAVAAAHAAVLSVRGGGWATRLASARQGADAAHARGQAAGIAQGVEQILRRSGPTVGAEPDPSKLDARLASLPPALRAHARHAWDDAPGETWRLVCALTDPDCPPLQAAGGWDAAPPPWLEAAPPRVLTLGGSLAATYGATAAARTLYARAVAAGVNRPSYWAARAAMLYELDEQDQAKDRLMAGGDPDRSVEPLARAVAAVLARDWEAARWRLAEWTPDDPTDWALWWSLSHRVAALDAGGRIVDKTVLDQTLAAADRALVEARRLGPVPTGLAVRASQFLVMRAQLGAADRPAGDLRRAQELAVRARDDRRAWRGDSAEAVEWACAAAVAAGDYRRAVELGSADGEATPQEAASPAVRRHVAAASAGLGTLDAMPDTDGMDEYDRQSLRALHAMATGADPAPHWRAALAAARHAGERVTALAGLAGAGGSDLTGLEEVEAEFPDVAAHVRALADVAAGHYDSAIARLRGPAAGSPAAAMTLADAYARAGRPDDAVAALQQAAERFSDPDMALAAVKVLYRERRRDEARAAADELVAAAPDGWAGRPEALQLCAQLRVDAGDVPGATALLRTSLELDPFDVRARWALARLLLVRGKNDAARRALAGHPESLQPLEPEHAHVWLDAHRHAGAAELARGAVQMARAFPDSEVVAAHAIIAVVTAGGEQPLPDDLLADVHAVQRDFFDRWPDSEHLQAIPFDADNPSQALEEMERLVAVDDDTARARRELHRRVVRQQLPLGALSAAVRRSHAEIVLARGLGTVPAWHPDPSEHQTSQDDAATSLDRPVVVETTALLVLGLLGQALRGTLLSAFPAVETTDSTQVDSTRAADSAAARSTLSYIYDDTARRGVFVESSDEHADRRAHEARGLADLARLLPARPAPPTHPDDLTGRDWGPWMDAARLAAADGTAVWTDDAPLRLLARALGARAFSTAALLDVLAARGAVPADDQADALRAMVLGRIGGIPLSPHALAAAAEEEGWAAGAAALALAEPVRWADPQQGLDLLNAVLPSVARHRPDAAPGWAYAAAAGIRHAHDDDSAVAVIAGTALGLAVHRLASSPNSTAALVAATRSGITAASLDPGQAPDPLPAAASALIRALSHALDPATAAQYVFAVFSTLPKADRAAVAAVVLAP